MVGKLGKEIQTRMTLFTEPNLTSGIDTALVTTAQSVPSFIIMMLLFVFCVVLIGGYSNQKRRVGYGDLSMWATLAGLTTSVLSLLLSLKGGLINGTTLGIVFAITILCALWFFIGKSKDQ